MCDMSTIMATFMSIDPLGALTQVPDMVLRPIFILLLIAGIAGSYLAYRVHRKVGPLLVTVLASILLYVSIYVTASDPLYYLSLALLFAGAIWNLLIRPKQAGLRTTVRSL